MKPDFPASRLIGQFILSGHHTSDKHRAKDKTINPHERNPGKDPSHHHDWVYGNPFSHHNRLIIEIDPPA
jgi:hypothetical protein